jgi:hypothetical protein
MTQQRKTTSEQALKAIQSKVRYVFDSDEFAQLTHRPPGHSVEQALQRLVRSRQIAMLRKNPTRWVIIPPEQQHYGAPPILWWLDDLMKQEDPNYYVGLLSAARHFGSAHYALQVTQVIVSKPRRPISLGKLKVEFIAKKNISGTPVETVRTGTAPWRVSTREATLLDLFRHLSAVGGLETVGRITRDFLPNLSRQALRSALQAMNQLLAAQRLGFVFDALGSVKHAKTVTAWLESKSLTVQPLERGTPGQEMHARWRVRFSPRQLSLLKELR